jgi:hypothetical protein
VASWSGPRPRPARHPLPGGLRSDRADRGADPAERLGRGRPSPGLRRRLLRPDPGEPAEAAGRHRRRLRDGPDRDHPARGLGRPDGLGRDRARVYRRDPGGLVFLGEAAEGRPGPLASPVCYADEIAPGHLGEPSG